MKQRVLLMLAVLLALCAGLPDHVALAKKKNAATVPTRVHFSGNMEGELEPCG
jgi:hypothetical protein